MSSQVIFTLILSSVALGRRFNAQQLLGALIVVVGLVLVALAPSFAAGGESAHGSQDTDVQGYWGVALIVGAQVFRSMQKTWEEHILSNSAIEPLRVVGTEGLYGFGVSVVLLLPLFSTVVPGNDAGGVVEDTSDTWCMVRNSPVLVWIIVVYFVSMLGLNAFGMFVVKELGAVVRVLMGCFRSLFVWLVDLLLWYAIVPGAGVGEQWQGAPSWLQVFGFLLVLCGMVMYAYGSALRQAEGTEVHIPSPAELLPAPKPAPVCQRSRSDGSIGLPLLRSVIRSEAADLLSPMNKASLRTLSI